jgi:hypothetical protein
LCNVIIVGNEIRTQGVSMGLFKKKEYVDEIIPEISGHKGEMNLTIKNMPIRREVLTSKVRYPPDFGSDLSEELLGRNTVTFEDVSQVLQGGNKFTIKFSIRKFPEMSLEISGNIPSDENQFYSDFLDAIIDAWKQNNIKS